MLILARRLGERILLETPTGFISVAVVDIRKGSCRIGIDAPANVIISRPGEESTDADH